VLSLSCAEGLFSIVPSDEHAAWKLNLLIDSEISEMIPVDLDGDGFDEVVTIEPFHGHQLCVYKNKRGQWTRVWQIEDLSFAHGLNAVYCGNWPVIVVGKRRADKELLGFVFDTQLTSKRFVLDTRVGQTQIEQWSNQDDGTAQIISCNQAADEVALYEVTLAGGYKE
jgi:hypothetical protein